MLSRLHPDDFGREIPEEWKEDFKEVLMETFGEKLPSKNHQFETYGELHSDEIVIIACLYDTVNLNHVPVSCFISLELDDKLKKDPKKSFGAMMDLCGLFFDEYFEEKEFTDFEPHWQETDYKNQTYFFKITRENIALTIEANKILNDDKKIN